MTSSMPEARRLLCELSPITQRSASTRFDLPQPFGPTTPVRPGSMRKSVDSTKDLKPTSRRRVSFMGRDPIAPRPSGGSGAPDSAPNERATDLVEFLNRKGPALHLAVDEERRRGIDVEVSWRRDPSRHSRRHRSVWFFKQASKDSCVNPACFTSFDSAFDRLVGECPVLLLREQQVDDGVVFVVAGAAREHESGRRQRDPAGIRAG